MRAEPSAPWRLPTLETEVPATADALRARLATCRRCLIAGYPIEGMPLHHNGPLPAPLYVLGQAPAAVHALDPTTPPFAPGRHGQPSPLWGWLARAGWEEMAFRRRAFITAITRCFPGTAPSGVGDRRPSAGEQQLCRPYWQQELILAQPELVITLGTMALHALGPRRLRLRDAVGASFPLQLADRTVPIIPLPHPSGVSRWLNDPAHQRLLDRALTQIDRLTTHLREERP